MAKAKKAKSKKIRKRFGRDALDWQERHSPTVEIAVDDPEAKRQTRRNLTRCRQSEAWRHNRLTSMQKDAEKEMEFAWRQRTAGLGASVSKYGLVPPGRHTRMDLGSDVETTWLEWAKEAPRRRIMIDAVTDCLAELLTLAQIEMKHRMRRSQGMANYTKGLDLWCELRGWMRGPVMSAGPNIGPEGPTRA